MQRLPSLAETPLLIVLGFGVLAQANADPLTLSIGVIQVGAWKPSQQSACQSWVAQQLVAQTELKKPILMNRIGRVGIAHLSKIITSNTVGDAHPTSNWVRTRKTRRSFPSMLFLQNTEPEYFRFSPEFRSSIWVICKCCIGFLCAKLH